MESYNSKTEKKVPGRLSYLDSFRGIAIIWIVCFHLLRHTVDSYGEFIKTIIKNGHLGVEIFFVISGYGIIASIQKMNKNENRVFPFLKKRLLRIYNTYLISLFFVALIIPIASSILSALKGHPFSIKFCEYSFSEWLQFITLTKVFSAESWWLTSAFSPLNGSVWYIAVLAQIYIVMAAAIFFRKNYSKIIIAISFLSLISLIPSVKEHIPYGLFLPYWIEFSVGIFLFYLIANRFTLNLGEKSKIIYLFLLILHLAVSWFLMKHMFSKTLFAFLVGILFWLIYPVRNHIERTMLFRFFIGLGIFSYSLYLLHVPLFPLVDMFVRNFVPMPLSISYPLVLIPAVLAISYVWYLFFEKPGSFKGSLYALRMPYRTIRKEIFRQPKSNACVY